MKKLIIKASKFFYWLFTIILILIILINLSSLFKLPINLKVFSVKSGSMSPVIPIGSLIIVKPESKYKEQDIITFKSSELKTTTHRIYKTETLNNQTTYITKGDANNTPDRDIITKNLILGKVWFMFPYLGKPILFIKTKEGFILLIIIPATIIIYNEILVMKKEFIKLFKKKKKK